MMFRTLPYSGSPRRCLALFALLSCRSAMVSADLPVPCGSGCTPAGGPAVWVSAGAAQAPTISGGQMTIRQTSANATLNWQSFNIGDGNAVEFKQPSSSSVALNRVWDPSNNPSRILGVLKANGQVYLLNRNGILFGDHAQVNVASLMASSLNLTDTALNKGLIRALLDDKGPALVSSTDRNGKVINGDIVIDAGANIRTQDGGQILIFAPNITNAGSITAPNGQAVLASGNKVYLATSSDPNLRGMLVEVDVSGVSDAQLQSFLKGETAELPLGKVVNAGSIEVGTGNASLIGLAVNQSGLVSATTSVRANGTISLRAEDSLDRSDLSNGLLTPTRGGGVTLAGNSRTQVLPDYSDPSTTVDVNTQPLSRIDVIGHTVHVGENASIVATGGAVQLTAQANPSIDVSRQAADSSRILIDKGVTIDVSGANVDLPADRLELQVQLHSDELKNSPQQRDGVLKGKTITVDLRQKGVRDDGTVWVGTPLADTSGAIAAIQRGVGERSVNGGTVNLVSQGDVIVAPTAIIDVSGGQINYAAGQIHTTQLLSQGKLYDIATADPNRTYDAVLGLYSSTSKKWGITQTWQLPGSTMATYSPAFSEGHNAGSVTFNAPQLILDGNVKGSIVTGPYQRLAATAPRGGTLIVGNQSGNSVFPANYRSNSVAFHEDSILEGLTANGFDPLTDPIPSDNEQIILRPSLFSAEGVANGLIYSNGAITLPADTHLSLPEGGSLTLNGNSVDIAGRVTAPGGSISANAVPTVQVIDPTAQTVSLRNGATLDTHGEWTNDNPLLGDISSSPIWIDGGSVSLSSQRGDVVIESGTNIDISGSAWLTSGGQIKDGKAGKISLTALGGSSVQMDGNFRGYALKHGGTFNLTTNSVCVSSAGCGDKVSGGGGQSGITTLSPAFFQSGGFANYSLTATRGDLAIAADAAIRPRQSNLVLDGSNQQQVTGTDIERFSKVGTLPDYQREPTNVAFSSQGDHPAQLRMEQGATISSDPGASVSLSADSRMMIDGAIAAPGGTIALQLKRSAGVINFSAKDVLWLGADANLDVAGVTRLQPDPAGLGLRTGEVLAGGSVSLTADGGYVVTQAGSSIDVSGTTSQLDLRNPSEGFQTHQVSSNAGSVTVRAAEGAVLDGAIIGKAGSTTALGGTFSLTLDGNTRGEPSSQNYSDGINNYPHAPRTIEIVAGNTPSDLNGIDYDTFGQAYTDAHDGLAKLRTTLFDQSGIDAVQLTSRNLMTNKFDATASEQVRSPGKISIASSLQLGRRLVLDTPVLEAAAPDVSLAAPYVALGNTDVNTQAVPVSVPGNNRLKITGQWLDLVGASTVSGASDVTLHSDNDLRLRAPPQLDISVRALTGSLTSAGRLELDAGQIYPVSLTDFTLSALDAQAGDGSGAIVIGGGNAVTPVLSAGGAVHMRASNIVAGGVIKAPFGTIDLQAGGSGPGDGSLVLSPGSLLSTSADNQIVPLGHTEGGLDWSYDLGNTQKLVLRPDLDPVPQQKIQLTGRSVQLRQGATLNVSGGGDIQAYEFVPGVGGSSDILALNQSTRSYAVLPALGSMMAPFDQEESAGFAPLVGTTVYLDGAGGLPAGEYALLPARYALLPGAFLVTEVPAYRDLPTGQHITLLNGLPVVAGTFGVAGTDQRESRTRAFSVMSSDLLRNNSASNRPAEYNLSLASRFFAAQDTAASGVQPRLPADAGVVDIGAQSSLDLSATLNGAASAGGRGAALDIAAPNILVTGPNAGTAASDTVAMSATALNDLGAESILLGGRRETATGGTANVQVTSSTVAVGADAVLRAPELLLAASDGISVAGGASLVGKGAIDPGYSNLLVNGDGALLRVSGGKAVDVQRLDSGGASGTIEVAAGAVLQAQGSANIEASKDIKFSGNLAVTGASLAIGAPQINLGDAPADTLGFTIGAADLNKLGANELLLTGARDINFYNAPQINAASLKLDTPSLVARSGDGSATTRIEAHQVTLLNSSAVLPEAPPDQTYGRLEVTADNIVLAEGKHSIAGFDNVVLTAHDSLLGRDAGSLQVSGSTASNANLALKAGVIGGQAGATTQISATGDVTIPNGEAPAELGSTDISASLNISGASIRDEGRIVAPAGLITLHASGSGGVTIANGAVLDAGGVTRQFDTTEAFAPAGSITLNASSGDVTVERGASVNVSGAAGSGAAGGDAGRLDVAAPQGVVTVEGALRGAAVADRQGGSVSLDGSAISDLNALNSALNAAGFNNERLLRVRQGDVDLSSDVVAHHIAITVDGAGGSGGALSIDGALNAAGVKGGQVQLAAHGSITLTSGASIDVSASGAGRDGGAIDMTSQTGGVKVLSGSSMTAAGGPAAADGSLTAGRDGTLNIGVNRDVLSAWLSSGDGTVALDGATDALREIVLEGVKTYDYGNANVTLGAGDVAAGSAQTYTDAAAFMLSAPSLTAALGRNGDPRFHVRPGVTLQTAGNLTLNAPWDLYNWRFSGEPGYLTLRAGGNLVFNQTLSDGISSDVTAGLVHFLDQPVGDSWSYRLAAGADLSSASPLAVSGDAAAGSLFIAPGSSGGPFGGSPVQTAIRTGTGNVDIAAAGDVILGNDSSVIYTMGVPVTDLSSDMQTFVDFFSLQTAALAEHGGDITIQAGGNITGAPGNQLVTDWLWRSASIAGSDFPSPTMWGVEFSRFRQGVGALAGGDVSIAAGGNIDNVSAAVPTIGVPLGETQYDNVLSIRGGGDLQIRAGGDIGGGVYYVGQGTADLSAEGNIRAGTGWAYLGTPLHTTLALGDGVMNLTARQNLTIETVFNPTLLSPSPQEAATVSTDWLNDFLTYAPTSGISLTSVGGDTSIEGNVAFLAAAAKNGLMVDNSRSPEKMLTIFPPSLRMEAFAGDINSGASGQDNSQYINLVPAAQGQLQLLAEGSIRFLQNGILLSDADPSLLPSPLQPQAPASQADTLTLSILSLLYPTGQYAHSGVPVHSSEYADAVGYQGPRLPALIVAQSGDIDMSHWQASQFSNTTPAVYSAEPVTMVAGSDILDPSVSVLHTQASDVSTIIAGGDIAYSVTRNATRQINSQHAEIDVNGPGNLIVTAGGAIDLKTSDGIVSRGNTIDVALPSGGANVIAMSGLSPAPNYDAFIAAYLEGQNTYSGDLSTYLTGLGISTTEGNAVQTFRGLSNSQQVPFITQVLFDELRATGRKVAADGSADFSRGYAAIDTLFPGTDPLTNAHGDMSLYFSRIYTLDGGDVNVLAPSGTVNVGLATPPASFGIAKTPAQLGVVAQSSGDVNILSGGDTLVNQSRVFAADGGSILMWSSKGNIDAGRGAKTAISAPPPLITYDPQTGFPTVVFPPALAGSGIRAFVTTPGRKPGDVDLYAPVGVVNASDAGIGSAGNVTIAATEVIGAGNIDVGGIAVGVPVADTGSLAAGLTGISNIAGDVTKSSVESVNNMATQTSSTPLADAALTYLDVVVFGLGSEPVGNDPLNDKRNGN